MKDFNKKWWFRLIIVVYSLLGLTGVLISVDYFKSDIPSFSATESTFQFLCNDGFNGGKFTYGYSFSRDGEISTYDSPARKNSDYYFKNSSFIKLTKIICANYNNIQDLDKEKYNAVVNDLFLDNGMSLAYIPQNEIETNYKIIPKDIKYYSSWKQAIISGLSSLLVTAICLFIIRYIFFYIVAGKHKLIFNEKIRKEKKVLSSD